MLNKINNVTVVGAGPWGSAIANLISKNGYKVNLITNKDDLTSEINQNKTHKSFCELKFSDNLKAYKSFKEIKISEIGIIFLAIQSYNISNFISELDNEAIKIINKNGLVVCSKGMDEKNLRFFHEIIEEKLPNNIYGILSGPNFASEVVNEEITVSTLATKNIDFFNNIEKILNNNYFKIYYSDNIIATEIFGILKNIIAIACGFVDGLKLGRNTKAAILTSGLNDIKKLCNFFEVNCNLYGNDAIGDIFLTCSSEKSRNYSLGFNLAKGSSFNEITKKINCEGATATKSLIKLAEKYNLDLKLTKFIYNLLKNDKISKENSIEKLKEAIFY